LPERVAHTAWEFACVRRIRYLIARLRPRSARPCSQVAHGCNP
jgi:hypothetical protein